MRQQGKRAKEFTRAVFLSQGGQVMGRWKSKILPIEGVTDADSSNMMAGLSSTRKRRGKALRFSGIGLDGMRVEVWLKRNKKSKMNPRGMVCGGQAQWPPILARRMPG